MRRAALERISNLIRPVATAAATSAEVSNALPPKPATHPKSLCFPGGDGGGFHVARGGQGAILEASDFTARLISGAESESVTFEA